MLINKNMNKNMNTDKIPNDKVGISCVKTFNINIYVGFYNKKTGETKTLNDVYRICQEYCNVYSDCFSVTPTKFIYKNGNEDGAIITIINYPRFPETENKLIDKAISLGNKLKEGLNQYAISIVTPNNTFMILK